MTHILSFLEILGMQVQLKLRVETGASMPKLIRKYKNNMMCFIIVNMVIGLSKINTRKVKIIMESILTRRWHSGIHSGDGGTVKNTN